MQESAAEEGILDAAENYFMQEYEHVDEPECQADDIAEDYEPWKAVCS